MQRRLTLTFEIKSDSCEKVAETILYIHHLITNKQFKYKLYHIEFTCHAYYFQQK